MRQVCTRPATAAELLTGCAVKWIWDKSDLLDCWTALVRVVPSRTTKGIFGRPLCTSPTRRAKAGCSHTAFVDMPLTPRERASLSGFAIGARRRNRRRKRRTTTRTTMDDVAFESFRTELLTLLEQPMELDDSDPGPVRLADEIVALLARYGVDLRA
jgi:hypothetical protein